MERETSVSLWLKRIGAGQMRFKDCNCETDPSPAILTGGIGGGNSSQYAFFDDGKPTMKTDTTKPPFRVPSMAEINALPWNGFKVASTFSGCGGSCLGYRMAGFKVVWANEFVPMAQQSYKANAASDCHLDGRDIKLVQPEEILAVTGLQPGELDLFDGSPPCQAFSTAGKREKGWGKQKEYEHGAKQCNETLFDHYIRLLRGLKPKVFVAENVSGLIKGTAKGYFFEILAAMKASGYRVTCRVLDAQWLGVPQQRQRTIFVGVREDLNLEPVHPLPLSYRYSVRDALPWIASCKSGPTGFGVGSLTADTPAPAVSASMQAPYSAHEVVAPLVGLSYERGSVKDGSNWKPHNKVFNIEQEPCGAVIASESEYYKVQTATEKRKFTIAELKRICAFPDDFILCGSYAQQWERLGNSVPPVMMKAIAETIRDGILRKINLQSSPSCA
jgi:DNA (cytosine-5)-methyltransferase 1